MPGSAVPAAPTGPAGGFDPARLRHLPSCPGVYRFVDARGRALYLGRATDLRSRVRSYWGDLRDRRHLARMILAIAAVEALPCASVHEAAWLERCLLEEALPRWNRARGGAEVPLLLRLDSTPAAPSLRTAYDPVGAGARVRYFGPYLGGTKVRLAVRGLLRVLPLTSTATGLTGFRADLARQLGVGSDDRSTTLEALRSVLSGDPGAAERVLADLAGRRDRLAAQMAFEAAAVLQQELEAVAWILQPQRVVQLSADDPTTTTVAAGRTGGWWVVLRVRDGRVVRWSRHRAAPAAGTAATTGATSDGSGLHGLAEAGARLADALVPAAFPALR